MTNFYNLELEIGINKKLLKYIPLIKLVCKNIEIVPFFSLEELKLWGGGRYYDEVGENISIDDVKLTLQNYKCKIILTNFYLTKEDIPNIDNTLKDIKHKIELVIANDDLVNDFQKLGYKVMRSWGSFYEFDSSKLNIEKILKYDFLCPTKPLVDYFSKIALEKLCVILNVGCELKCPVMKEHMEEISKSYINKGNNFKYRPCPFKNTVGLPDMVFTREEFDKLKQLGVKKFKLEGRQSTEERWKEKIKKSLKYYFDIDIF